MRTALHASINGHEVTSRRVTESSVKCRDCGEPASLDADKLCAFCRRRLARVEERTNDAQQGLLILAALAAVAVLVWLFL